MRLTEFEHMSLGDLQEMLQEMLRPGSITLQEDVGFVNRLCNEIARRERVGQA